MFNHITLLGEKIYQENHEIPEIPQGLKGPVVLSIWPKMALGPRWLGTHETDKIPEKIFFHPTTLSTIEKFHALSFPLAFITYGPWDFFTKRVGCWRLSFSQGTYLVYGDHKIIFSYFLEQEEEIVFIKEYLKRFGVILPLEIPHWQGNPFVKRSLWDLGWNYLQRKITSVPLSVPLDFKPQQALFKRYQAWGGGLLGLFISCLAGTAFLFYETWVCWKYHQALQMTATLPVGYNLEKAIRLQRFKKSNPLETGPEFTFGEVLGIHWRNQLVVTHISWTKERLLYRILFNPADDKIPDLFQDWLDREYPRVHVTRYGEGQGEIDVAFKLS